tara:strand:- start:382 stop:687 length:306 start_codon:yes stop_codon:yes gene_type:complete
MSRSKPAKVKDDEIIVRYTTEAGMSAHIAAHIAKASAPVPAAAPKKRRLVRKPVAAFVDITENPEWVAEWAAWVEQHDAKLASMSPAEKQEYEQERAGYFQ